MKDRAIIWTANTAAVVIVAAIPASFIAAVWTGEWRLLLITAGGVAIARACMKKP